MPVSGISVKRRLKARRERVFQAWTRPDLMARWFFPDAEWSCEAAADARVGGRYEVRMRDSDGALHTQFGEYREVVPVSRLVFTWNCPELAVENSVVTVDLIDRGHETELILTHELPPDPKIRRGHEDGWNGCLQSLETFLKREHPNHGTPSEET